MTPETETTPPDVGSSSDDGDATTTQGREITRKSSSINIDQVQGQGGCGGRGGHKGRGG